MDALLDYVFKALPGIAFFLIGLIVIYYLFKTTIDNLKTSNETLQSDFARVRQEFDSLRVQVLALEDKNIKYKQQLESLEDKNTKIKHQLDALRTYVDQLKTNLEASMDRFNALSDTITSVGNTLHEKSGETDTTLSRIEAALQDHSLRLVNMEMLIKRALLPQHIHALPSETGEKV